VILNPVDNGRNSCKSVKIDGDNLQVYFNDTFCAEIDICDSTPCKNGATCRQDMGKYRCECAAGYNGTTCETGG